MNANEPCPNCGEYHSCTELIEKLQAENEALKSLFNNCRVSDFTPPQKAIIRQGFEAIWDEMIAKEPWPEMTEMINDTLHEAVQKAQE